MNRFLLAVPGILCFFAISNAHASQWQKVISCRNAESTFVADRDSENPERVQFVIEGAAAPYVANSIRGNSIMDPPNLHFYDNGNKLVISNLTASQSLYPATPDPYVINVTGWRGNGAILSWISGSDLNPVDRYGFYNCSGQ